MHPAEISCKAEIMTQKQAEEFLSYYAGFHTCIKLTIVPLNFVAVLSQTSILSFCLFFLLSGVGTRNYYRKMGYELEGPYMVKRLD